jgi:diaminopimelate epimerase
MKICQCEVYFMEINFKKYHGTGNDFILIDNRSGDINLNKGQIAFICHRQFGIGADGLILLSNKPGFDFQMTYYNSDGGEGTMCGNGGRCITAFAAALGVIDREAGFSAIDGEHFSEIKAKNGHEFYVSLKMSDVTQVEKVEEGFFINTGSPHLVKFVSDIEKVDAYKEGKQLRWDKRFQPAGTNVNFVEIKGDLLIVRSFERGVENITLSCGTGVTASALAASVLKNDDRKHFNINTLGGDLKVRFDKLNNTFKNIWLEGPAVMVFEGQIEI